MIRKKIKIIHCRNRKFTQPFTQIKPAPRKAAAGGGVSSQLLITLELLIENVVVSSNSPEFLKKPGKVEKNGI